MRTGRAPSACAIGLLGAGCSGIQSALDPAGPDAARIGDLWWLMLCVGAAVFAAVMAMLAWALLRRREGRADGGPATAIEQRHERRMGHVVAAAVGLTAVILLAFLVASFQVGRDLAAGPSEPALAIEVTAQRWWWDVRYHDPQPSRRFRTANEIRIPVGQPVELRLRSIDVIHSFWVPSLAGKKDLIPGQVNTLTLRAERPGTFRGQCAEFCGFQHAHMALFVVALATDEFERWREQQLRPAPEPQTEEERRGREVFMSGPCVLCHAVGGTLAQGVTGPDLTHVASRKSLAAGTLPNTPSHLAGWILDPQAIKPGANMPPNPLGPDELQALLGYLDTLQ